MKIKLLDYLVLGDATTNIGRAYPQIQTTEGRIHSTLTFLGQGHRDALPYDDNLSFDRFIIEKSAKRTDKLSTSPFNDGFIFSEKLINLLQQFTLPPYKIYKAIIQKKGTDILYDGYYVFMVEKMMYRYFAFDRMNFRDTTDRKNIIRIKIKDVAEFEHLRYAKRRIIGLSEDSSYIFTKEFQDEMDLFAIGGVNSYNTFVSKRLREAFITQNITGVDFEDDCKLFQLDE